MLYPCQRRRGMAQWQTIRYISESVGFDFPTNSLVYLLGIATAASFGLIRQASWVTLAVVSVNQANPAALREKCQ